MNKPLIRSVIAVALASLVTAACGDTTSSPSARSSSAITTQAPTTTDTVTATTDAAPTTTAAPTTSAEPDAIWVETDAMPSLAYLPCCASNYFGEPSPEIPIDGAAPLSPGVYRAFREQPTEGGAFDPGTIEVSLAPFEPCGTPGVFCEEPFAADEVGVGAVARKEVMALTDDVRVVVGGFRCLDAQSNWTTDHQGGTGTLLAALQTEFEAAYAATVAPLVGADTPFEDYATIFAQPVAGFGVPCQFAGVLQWQGSAGPALLLQTLGRYDDAAGRVLVPASISVEILQLTAFELADDGTQTLYFYAGFMS